jgi:hypothetical protein
MGYDISDYTDIDDRYGSLADVDELIAHLSTRDMKLMMDLVVNHTSDQVTLYKPYSIPSLTIRSIRGFSNLARLLTTPRETGTFGERARSTKMADACLQTTGAVSWTLQNQHGSGTRRHKNTIFHCSRQSSPISTGKIQTFELPCTVSSDFGLIVVYAASEWT